MPSRYGFETRAEQLQRQDENRRRQLAAALGQQIGATVRDVLADYARANHWNARVRTFEGSFNLSGARSWMAGGVEVALDVSGEDPSLAIVLFPGCVPHAANEARLCAVLNQLTGLPVTHGRLNYQRAEPSAAPRPEPPPADASQLPTVVLERAGR